MDKDISSNELSLTQPLNTSIQNIGQKRIVLCADDFGMNSAVNNGILQLAQKGRLCATSILVDGPNATTDINDLLNSGLQLGLHLNLTESFGQDDLCLSLKKIILKSYSLSLSKPALSAAIRRQLDLFCDIVGFEPAYIDGHQHVHQLPIVRDALFEQLGTLSSKPWIRNTAVRKTHGLPGSISLKAHIIAGLGSKALGYRAKAYGYKQNNKFLGVYDFKGGSRAYESYMRNWLAACEDGDVLMCHPAFDPNADDSFAQQRHAEYTILSGALMEHLLARNNLICKTI